MAAWTLSVLLSLSLVVAVVADDANTKSLSLLQKHGGRGIRRCARQQRRRKLFEELPDSFLSLTGDQVTLGPGVINHFSTSSNGGLVDGKYMQSNYDDYKLAPEGRSDNCDSPETAPYVTLDLGEGGELISGVKLWHFWQDGRQYCNQALMLSMDGTNWDTIWDTGTGYGPSETRDGHEVNFEATRVRYVRHRLGRSTTNVAGHFVEIKVRAAPVPTYVDVSSNGKYVMGLFQALGYNMKGKAADGDWMREGTTYFLALAMTDDGEAVGVTPSIWRKRDGDWSRWNQGLEQLQSISVSGNGNLYMGVGLDNMIYHRHKDDAKWHADDLPGWVFDHDDTGSVTTYDQAVAFCEDKGLLVASYDDMCPDGKGTKPVIGSRGADQWAPISDYDNGWVQVGGDRWPDCYTHRDVAGGNDPSWGTETNKRREEANFIYCKDPDPNPMNGRLQGGWAATALNNDGSMTLALKEDGMLYMCDRYAHNCEMATLPGNNSTRAISISMGSPNEVWMIDQDYNIWHAWIKRKDPDATEWIPMNKMIKSWTKVDGKMRSISATNYGAVYGVSMDCVSIIHCPDRNPENHDLRCEYILGPFGSYTDPYCGITETE